MIWLGGCREKGDFWDILYGSGVNNLNIGRELWGRGEKDSKSPIAGNIIIVVNTVRQGRVRREGGRRWVFHTVVWLKSADVLSFVASVVVVVVAGVFLS